MARERRQSPHEHGNGLSLTKQPCPVYRLGSLPTVMSSCNYPCTPSVLMLMHAMLAILPPTNVHCALPNIFGLAFSLARPAR